MRAPERIAAKEAARVIADQDAIAEERSRCLYWANAYVPYRENMAQRIAEAIESGEPAP